MTFRPGVRLGVDVGSVRVGVAACDRDGILASPVETLPRDAAGFSDAVRIGAEARERGAIEIVVGLPRSMDGARRKAADLATAYARGLAARVAPIPVRLVDERLSTVDAHRALRGSGVTGRKQRKIVDTVAAVIILQHAIDVEHSTGTAPGEVVRPKGEPKGPGSGDGASLSAPETSKDPGYGDGAGGATEKGTAVGHE